MRQSFQSLEARELYMPPKKIASSPTRIGLVWQQSIASLHSTIYLHDLSATSSQALLLVPIGPQFPASTAPPIAKTIEGISWFIERKYET